MLLIIHITESFSKCLCFDKLETDFVRTFTNERYSLTKGKCMDEKKTVQKQSNWEDSHSLYSTVYAYIDW